MPIINWPKAPLPNRQEGERAPQMVDNGGARMHAASWGDRIRDVMMPLMGDPASDAMGLAGPMELPGALGLGIVKTLTPKVMTRKALPDIIKKTGAWGRGGPANEALEYLAQKFPRLAQQVEFVMDPTLRKGASASWAPDSASLPFRAQMIAEGEGRELGKVGRIRLNPNIHMGRSGGDSAADSVNSIAHEMQHVSDNLRFPQTNDNAYHMMNRSPFTYETNPYENLANITGAMEQGKFQLGRGASPDAVDELLDTTAGPLTNSFPPALIDVVQSLLPKSRDVSPADFMRAMRRPNRAIADIAERSASGGKYGLTDSAKQWERFNKALKSPDALRKAILSRQKGR